MPLVLIGLIPNLVVMVFLVRPARRLRRRGLRDRLHDRRPRGGRRHPGPTFAFLYSAIRVILFAVIAVAPFVAAGFTALVRGVSGTGTLRIAHVSYEGIGYNCVMLLAAVIAVWVGVVSYRQMDDRRGVPLREDLVSAVRGEEFQPVPGHVNGYAAAPRPARRVHRAGRRRGRRQDHAGPAARHLAARPGLRRGHHPGAGRDQDRHAAARRAAGHRARRPVRRGPRPCCTRRTGPSTCPS